MTNTSEGLIPLEEIFTIRSSPIALSTTFNEAANNKFTERAAHHHPDYKYDSDDQTFILDRKPFNSQNHHTSELSISEDERLKALHPASKYYMNVASIVNPQHRMHLFITRYPVLSSFFGKNVDTVTYPMYIPNESFTQLKLNIQEGIIKRISFKTGLTFLAENVPEGNVCMAGSQELRPEFRITFSPMNLLDYIYAAGNSNMPDELSITEPLSLHIPLPIDSDMFWQLVEAGAVLRRLHLLLSPDIKVDNIKFLNSSNLPVEFPLKLEEFKWEADSEGKTGRIWLNTNNYIANIPLSSWNFSIGGYYPIQQWAVDRHESFIDEKAFHHFTSVITAVTETNKIMEIINEILNKNFN